MKLIVYGEASPGQRQSVMRLVPCDLASERMMRMHLSPGNTQ
jgi:hypothetical protein